MPLGNKYGPNPPKRSHAAVEKKLIRLRGAIVPSSANIRIILTCAPEWEGLIVYDEWTDRIRVTRNFPLCDMHLKAPIIPPMTAFDDAMIVRLQIWCEREYGVAATTGAVWGAVRDYAKDNTYHPIRNYLGELQWDGVARLDAWLTTYARVEDSPYVRAVGSKWMISAAARIFDPGCKVDHVLIFEGEQRGGKSSVLRALCKDEEWFLETNVELGTKDAYQVIRSKWIVELAELDALSRAEVSKVKAFITGRIDTYRESYGRAVIDVPRGCVFAGTTNETDYLKDDTGGGRWWPVFTPATQNDRLDIPALERDRDQLWAEAVVRYRKGEAWHLTDPALIAAATKEQEARRQRDPWEDVIRGVLAQETTLEKGVTIARLLPILGVETARAGKGDSMRIARILRGFGWAKCGRPLDESGKQRVVYRRASEAGVH